MGVSNKMIRNIYTGRVHRGSGCIDKGVKLDLSKGAAENIREILLNVCKKHGLPESQQVGYLNAFVKIISSCDKDYGFPVEDILLCLRPILVHDSSHVRAAVLRCVKFLIHTKQDFATCIRLQYPCLLTRSLDLLLDNDCERTQALRVVRRLLSINAAEFPIGLARCLVSLTMTPLDIRDRLIRAVLGTLVELCVLNPDIFIASGGVKALTRVLCNVGSSSRIGEAVVGALLFLVNKPETRVKAAISFDCLAAPFTDPHTIGRPSDINISTESQLQWAHYVLVSLLRSWPGVLHFCHPEKDGLRSIVNTLYLNQREVRKAVLDLLYDLLCLAQPEWSDEISVALDAVDPSRYQESFKLADGFVASEGKTVLPHISKSRVNIVEVHLALLLYCFLEVGLLDAIVEVIVSDDTFLSVRATILLGELLHLIHLLLPPECCHLTPALPNLLSYAVRGRPATCINQPTVTSCDKDYAESHFERFKRDSVVPDDNRQKKKESISSVSRTERVRTVSSQSCRSRTVSDSSVERSRIDRLDNDPVIQAPLNEPIAFENKTATRSRTANVLKDVRDALSDITERHSASATVENGAPYVSEYDNNLDPQLFNVPDQFPLSPNLPIETDIPSVPNPVNIDPPYSSRAQQRALTAVSALSQLHRLLRKRPAPSSIFLDHLITCIDRKEPPNCYDIFRTKGRTSSNKNKLMQVLTKECEEAIKESGVLTVKDPFIWNWDSIRAILKGKAPCLYESSQRQFLRKLIQFLLPKSRNFLRVDVGVDRRAANAFTLTAFELIDCLLLSPEDSECEKLLLELLSNISNEIGTLLSSKSAHDCLFSPQNVLNTLCSDYFFYIGHLSRTPAGYKALEKVNLMQQLYDLVSTTNHECYVKMSVSVLDYTKDNLTRKILGKALTSQNLSCRLYSTKLLHVMLRTPLHNHPDMVDWIIELLVNQLYDEEKVVVNAAVQAFDEACDCKEYLEAIVKLRPSLLHLGESGLLLLIRFLSTTEGFSYLREANFVFTQLERWATHYNYKYVCLVESQLCDSMSLHQRGDDGRYCARLSGIKHSPAELFLPPHLYGQLTQHEAGFNVLKADENVRKQIKIVILGHCRTDDEILQLKAALWALGHITGSVEGAKWARNNRVTMAMVHTACFCQVYSVRATAFYALNITATNPEGATTLRSAGWHTVRHHRHEKWPVLATSDLLEDISSFIDIKSDNERDFNRSSMYSNEGVDVIGKNGIFYLPKDSSTAESDDDFILRLPSSSKISTAGGKSATLPHYIGSSVSGSLASKYFHSRSASESKADAPSSVNDDSSSLSPYYDVTNMSDISDIRIFSDIDRKSRSNSFTTGSSSSNSNISGFGSNNDSVGGNKLISSVFSDKVQTLSPIPSAGSLTTVKSTGTSQSQAVRKSSYTSNVTRKQSGARLSHQDAIGYAALKLLHKSRRPLPTPVPALSPLSPIELIAFQDLKQMSPLVRPRHSSNKPLISEFEAQGVKLSHLLSEVGVPPTLPYQSSRSCITCPSDASTPDDDNGWNGPSYMGICLPQRLAELFPDDEEPRIVNRTGAKESFRLTDTNLDAGIENISSAESETDTGTDTGGYGGVISVQMEGPIKRRHNRNNCLLCSTSRSNNQRVSRWRKVSASSTHRTRTETESSYGGAPGEGESPIMLPWQTKGGLEGVNSVDSSSTDVTSIAQRSISDNLKSRSMVRRDVLKLVEQLSNPVLYKTCKQALLHMKQMYSDVFQDICVYSDVYNIISSTSHRIQSRRFLQELFLDIPFTEMYEESAAFLAGGESGDEFDEESTLAISDDTVDPNAVPGVTQNELTYNYSLSNDNNSANVNFDNDYKNDVDTAPPIVSNGNTRFKSNNGKSSLPSSSSITGSSIMGGNSSIVLQLEVIPENDARSDTSDPFTRFDSRDNSIVCDTFIAGEINKGEHDTDNWQSLDFPFSLSLRYSDDVAALSKADVDANKIDVSFNGGNSSDKIKSGGSVNVNFDSNLSREAVTTDDVTVDKELNSTQKTDDMKKAFAASSYSSLDKNRLSLDEKQETEIAKEMIKTTSNKITELQESLKFDRKQNVSVPKSSTSSSFPTTWTTTSNSASYITVSNSVGTTMITVTPVKELSLSTGILKTTQTEKVLSNSGNVLCIEPDSSTNKSQTKLKSSKESVSLSVSNQTISKISSTVDVSNSKDQLKKPNDNKSGSAGSIKKSSLPQKLQNSSGQNFGGLMGLNSDGEKFSKKHLNDDQSASGRTSGSFRNQSGSTSNPNRRQRKKATTKIPNRDSLEVDQNKDTGGRKK